MVFPGKGKTYQGIENGNDMSKLDDFIRDNAAAFDTELPPEGAEDRFLRKWEAGRMKVRIFRTVLPAAAAAALAAVLLLPPSGRSTDWLRGAGDTRFTAMVMLITIVGIRTTVAWLMVDTLHLGLTGAWIAVCADQICRSFIIMARYNQGKWKKIKL